MRSLFGTALLFLFAWDLYSLLPWRPPLPDPGGPSDLHYKQGIIHVHSIFSDGGGTPPEIARAAKIAGMDFVVLTDHNNARARREGFEKSYDGMDLFVEMEASTPAGHCLTFYSQTAARNLGDEEIVQLSYRHFMGKATVPGLFIASAHPSNLKIPWTVLGRAPDGMEVVNFDSIWRELADSAKLDFLTTLFVYPFNNFLAAARFLQPNPKDFLAWDTMNAVSKSHFGILGHDTHAKLKLSQKISLRWPDYLQTFRLGSNILFYKGALPDDFEARKRELYRSLREGRNAIAFQVIYPFRGNDWRVECQGGRYRSGDEIPQGWSGCEMVAELPRGFPYRAVFRLLRNGEQVQETISRGEPLRLPLGEPGVYRLEVWARMHSVLHVLLDHDVPYVLYNPIYVR